MRTNGKSFARQFGVTAALTVAASCSPDRPLIPPQSPTLSPALALNPGVAKPVNVPALDMDLPPAPRAWDQSDSALTAALQQSKGRAFVGLKSAADSRAAQTARAEVDVMSGNGRLVPKGTRAALTAADAVVGLNQLTGMGVEVLRYFENIGMAYVLVADPGLAGRLRAHANVDYVEPDVHEVRLARVSPSTGIGPRSVAAPRAPLPAWPHLTASAAVGSLSSSLFSQTTPWGISLVRAPDAWPYSTGSNSRLLIIDTGHERGHADLPLVPLGNCMGLFGACDDPPPSPPSTIPHGTHVTGIAVAQNNALGVVGVAHGLPASNLFVHAACDPLTNGCSMVEIITALNWATASLGPRGIVNMSLAGSYDQGQANAVAGASAAGHVLVAAMGNDASNQPFYPAALSNVISVAAILPTKAFAATPAPCPYPNGGSNWGNHVDFVAPWYALSTVPNSSYGDEATWPYSCGTSMATPHVAGLAALIRTKYPNMSASSVFTRMRDTAEPLGPVGWDDHYGFGLIRAHLAVTFDPPVVTPTIVAGKPRLTWTSIPFATQYRIYRRVTPSLCPQWTLWA